MKNDLTNQQLLQELDKRIKKGTIAFKQSEPVANSFTFGLNQKTILLFALAAVVLFYFSARTTLTRTNVQITDNSQADQPSPVIL